MRPFLQPLGTPLEGLELIDLALQRSGRLGEARQRTLHS